MYVKYSVYNKELAVIEPRIGVFTSVSYNKLTSSAEIKFFDGTIVYAPVDDIDMYERFVDTSLKTLGTAKVAELIGVVISLEGTVRDILGNYRILYSGIKDKVPEAFNYRLIKRE